MLCLPEWFARNIAASGKRGFYLISKPWICGDRKGVDEKDIETGGFNWPINQKSMSKIKIQVEKTRTGFSAYAEKYSAYTTGKTVESLVANMVESLNVYFEEEKVRRVVKPSDLLFEVDLTSVFEVFPVINVRALSLRLGMNYTLISQYATGKKKPSRNQAERIMEGIHQVGRELMELRLVG